MSKPIIAITSNIVTTPLNFSASQNVIMIPHSYIDLVTENGGIPWIINATTAMGSEHYVANLCDGLLIIGGQDVSPTVYNKECSVEYNTTGIGEKYKRGVIQAPDLERDKFEIEIYNCFKNNKKPIVGICRGMQIINVAEGGSLIQELPDDLVDHYLQPDGWINYHEIEIFKNTMVYDIMKKNTYFVSSVHHQGIDILGTNLRISAVAKDDLPEIIESVNNDEFIIGIQGHPEKTLKNLSLYNKIFKKFICVARSNKR